jgi:hypothetical protein
MVITVTHVERIIYAFYSTDLTQIYYKNYFRSSLVITETPVST